MKILKLTTKLFLISLLFLSFLPCFAQQNRKKINQIEKRIEEVMNLSNCPGMAVAVVVKDQIIYAKGFGYRDYENKKPATSNTLFAIGSCTKSFTAALIGQAEEKKQIDLDETPGTYVPALSFNNSEMNEFITVRDLLTHNTGLPRHDISWYLFPSNSRDNLVKRIKYQEPTLAVREGFQYNNFMYMLAGNIVENINAESWENQINSSLFVPLEMSRSNLSIAEFEKSKDAAFGYETKKDKSIRKLDYHPISGMAPAGSINSSVNEMGNWLIAWINGGKFKGKEIIPSDFVHEAISSQVTSSARMPGKKHPDLHFSNYGFGWDLSSYRGHYRVEHGGNIDGFSASTSFFPSDSIGVVVLVNQNYSGVQGIVRNMIIDKLLGLPSGKWDENLKKKTNTPPKKKVTVSKVSKRVKGTSYTHELEGYTGQFNHNGYGAFKISKIEDSLFAQFPTMKFWLRHNHYDVFEPCEIKEEGIDTSGGASFYFNFHSNMDGDIDGLYLNVESDLDPLFFKRELIGMTINTTDLEQYVGEYDLGGVMAKVFVTEENSLHLLVPGQSEYILIPSKVHKFILKDLEGYSVEFEEKDKRIIALTFMQPNGNFRVPKKQ
ncbi:MAG: serine hydrolase [Flavobacteriales bacterium]|nr:serine hydrolase [Flavobacteriales bacterium]